MAGRPNLTADVSPPMDNASSGEHTPTDTVLYQARGFGFQAHDQSAQESVAGAASSSWWGDHGGSRPWHNPPKRRKTIPPDQTVAFERTKTAVRKAASAALDITHEGLAIAVDILQIAPVMGLAEAARVLLNIWDSVEAVQTNRMSCLRLTERCATILYSVRTEINAAGNDVAETLREPVDKLIESFRRVEHFIQKQVSRPFLKRYLKRDEDARKILACDTALTDSVGLFGVTIQIRMLKELRAQGHRAPQIQQPHSSDVIAAIATIRSAQAKDDAVLDSADLYAAMRAALRMGSDFAMLDILQINKSEMAEAIKTIQRALEEPRISIGRSPKPHRGAGETDTLGLTSVAAPTSRAPSESSSSSSQYVWTPRASGLPTELSIPATSPIGWDPEQDAAFHREFLESGLDALRRLSGTAGGESLPPWTITRWEVDREQKIGVGFFSNVYKGVWRGQSVAIKLLARTTPRRLFQKETTIWASLKHAHVLELLGASSATGDPPWFFVSPYMKNGTLVTFLKTIADQDMGETLRTGRTATFPGPLQMMHEIAVGMAYLHRKGVFHGDLKANNVLIDDDLHCVISDFGQSELRSEVYRLSHRPQPHGTLRWQAPELISGESVMSPEVDVYAFAIVCVEILTNGDLPWSMLDDQVVQQLVLRDHKRPKIPLRPETSLGLVTLIEKCWSTNPISRPLFETIARELGQLEGGLRGPQTSPSPRGRVLELIREKEQQRSPEMNPVDGPDASTQEIPPFLSISTESPDSDQATFYTPMTPSFIPLQRVVTPNSEHSPADHPLLAKTPHDTEDTPPPRTQSPTASSVFSSSHGSSSEVDSQDFAWGWGGADSPPPRDDRLAARRNERRYRFLLQHDFNPSLNLPLWDPSPVRLGAVGYLEKPTGRFVTLFNANNPLATGDGRVNGLPTINGYGTFREAAMRLDKRPVAQKGFDMIQRLLTFKRGGTVDGTFSQSIKRRYSFQLRAGHKHAYLCTENTLYRYMVDADPAKAWFKANVKEIVRIYGYEHNIQREDIFLIIGALETRDYGLFVSHEHPDGQVHFNVFADQREGQDWGSFSTDTEVPPSMPGPHFTADGPDPVSIHASRISQVRAGADPDADAVLLAKLRFKPDEDQPTRM